MQRISGRIIWNDDLDQALLSGAENKISYADIAGTVSACFEITCTRNQVAGRLKRLKSKPGEREALVIEDKRKRARPKPNTAPSTPIHELPSFRAQCALRGERERRAIERAKSFLRSGSDPSAAARDLRDTLDFPATREWVLHNAC